ncbi:MAG: restriction endonuclease subunit S [Pseudomonas sp.]|uniref:restriction endonuclease subunit S n=1 Tax=Pseudomonas sp. TaxID=306 RepID=UPI0025E9717A|nr:restriction endonuclease subunit S [Pseudomonas sp.]MBW8354066.1 restriction endonuclease subunit S [Pseudomonas sp.]
MAVKAGYKQTEVGVIPDDWDVSTVGAEFEIKLGKMLDSEKNVGVPKPYLGNKSVQWGRIDISDLPTVPMTRADLEKYRLRDGDLLVCEGGDVGRAALWSSPLEECYYQKALHRLRPLRGFDSRLMVELLRQWSDRGLLANYVTQTSIAHLPREKFMGVPMPVPPVPEQRAIATALSDVDALLSALEQLLAKKRDLKQAAMQQLLTGQTRLPGFDGEWEVKLLGEIAHIKTGSRNNEDKVEDGQYPFFVRSEFVERISSYSYDCEAILVPGEGRIGDIFHYINGRFDVHQRVYAITKFLPDISGRFIYFYLSKNFGAWAMQNTVKATVDSLRLPTFLTFEIMLPPIKAEQIAITSVLADMDAELAAIEQRLSKTRTLKQGMMQELLTGRTRLL